MLKVGISKNRKSLTLITFNENKNPTVENIFPIDSEYDALDIIRFLNNEYLVIARSNDFRDMLIYYRDHDKANNIKVFDSRIKKNDEG